MEQGYWMTRTYTAGCVGEKIKYWVQGSREERKSTKQKDREAKARQNEASAVKRLARLLNANFSCGDMVVGLDYNRKALEQITAGCEGDMDKERKAAEHALSVFLRRLKRKAPGVRAVYITSDTDGKTGEAVRLHHHLVIDREHFAVLQEMWSGRVKAEGSTEDVLIREEINKAWKEGTAHTSRIGKQKDLTPIAVYLLRQVRHVSDAKAFSSTRNLKRPKAVDRLAISGAEIRPPKGCYIVERSEYRAGQPQYMRYIIDNGTTVQAEWQ